MSRHITTAEYRAALAATGGLIAPAAHRLGVTRAAIYKAIKRDPAIKEALEDARGDLLDAAEGNIFKAVTEGDLRVSCWVLERLGKDRGYSTRVQIEPPHVTARELEEMLDEQFEEYARKLGV